MSADLDFVRAMVWEGGVVGVISSDIVSIEDVPQALRPAYQSLVAAYSEWESAWYESGISELVGVVMDED